MTYLLDTNVFISAVRGSGAARTRLRGLSELDLRTSSAALFELLIGAYASRRVSEQVQRIGEMLTHVSVVEVSEPDAVTAAQLAAALVAQGHGIGAFDALIAGQALNRGWTVVTENVKHFIHVPDLEVVDWSRPWIPSE